MSIGSVGSMGAINAQIAQAVSQVKAPAAAAGAQSAGGSDFISSLDSALKSVSRNQQTSSELQRQFQLENPNVSLEQTMIAMNQSSLSFQAAVQVRNRLVQAYEQGIFPWYAPGEPVLWWSPDPRMVLVCEEFRVSRSLRKKLRALGRDEHGWQVRLDTAFADVMQACAQPRIDQDGTWITAAVRAAYGDLHARALAHSVEVWDGAALVGGLYGVSLGRMFYGESMFTRATMHRRSRSPRWYGSC